MPRGSDSVTDGPLRCLRRLRPLSSSASRSSYPKGSCGAPSQDLPSLLVRSCDISGIIPVLAVTAPVGSLIPCDSRAMVQSPHSSRRLAAMRSLIATRCLSRSRSARSGASPRKTSSSVRPPSAVFGMTSLSDHPTSSPLGAQPSRDIVRRTAPEREEPQSRALSFVPVQLHRAVAAFPRRPEHDHGPTRIQIGAAGRAKAEEQQ
jgi:hypothetical protein